MRRRFSLHLAAVICYGLLAFIILHRMLFTNGTHFAGYDYFNYHWNMWWIRHALTTPGLNVYQSDFVFFPVMNNFGYHALTMFWFPAWAVLEPFIGTLSAFNIIILICCILNGYVLFAFLRSEGIPAGLALLGGAVLQALPISRYFYYNTHLNLMNWFWLPLHLLLWKQTVSRVNAGKPSAIAWAIVQGIALWGLGLSELQFPIFVGFLLIPYGLVTLWRSPKKVALIGAGLLTLSVALMLLWFAGPLPYIARFSGILAPGSVDNRPGIPFPDGFLAMSETWWLWNTPSLGAFVPFALLFTLAFIRVRHKDCWLWFLLMIPPLLLALGPTLTVFGISIPMPFRLLHALTRGMFGMPWRLGPIFVVAAVIFLAKTWTPILLRLKRFAPLFVAISFLLMALSFRLYEAGPVEPLLKNYDFYRTIGAERGEPYDRYIVVEVPTGVGTGEVLLGDPRVITFQFYGMTHGKRMVNGFVSRAPVEDFYYILKDDPMLSWLGQRRPLDPQAVETQLRERIFNWPIGYIIVHQDYIGKNGSTNQEIIGYLNRLNDLLCPFMVEGDVVVYRTRAHPDGCSPRTPAEVSPGVYQINIGSSGDEKYIGWGWHWPEQIFDVSIRWMGEYPQTELYVDLPPGAYDLSFNAQAFAETRNLKVLANGTPLGNPVAVQPTTLQDFSFHIPADVIGNGKHVTITLQYDKTIIPANVGQSTDPRRLAIMVDRVVFRRSLESSIDKGR